MHEVSTFSIISWSVIGHHNHHNNVSNTDNNNNDNKKEAIEDNKSE